MHSSGSRSPCSHICARELYYELNYTVDHSICTTSGGTPGMCWRNPRIPGNLGWKKRCPRSTRKSERKDCLLDLSRYTGAGGLGAVAPTFLLMYGVKIETSIPNVNEIFFACDKSSLLFEKYKIPGRHT